MTGCRTEASHYMNHMYQCLVYANYIARRQWGRVGWMLADHREGLSVKVFRLILDSSVGLSAGIQSAGDSVPETPWVRILHSAEENKMSPFDSTIACLCQSIEINNNKHVYRQIQVRMPNGSGVERTEGSLIIGTGCMCVYSHGYVFMYMYTYTYMYMCIFMFLLYIIKPPYSVDCGYKYGR